MTIAIAILVFLLGVLALSSYVERVYTEMGKFLSREFQDNIEVFEQKIIPRLGAAASRAHLSMALLSQLATAGIALVIAYTVIEDGRWDGLEVAQALLAIILCVVIFNRLLPYVFFTRTSGEWLAPFAPALRLVVYAMLPVTLVLGFCQQIAALTEQGEPEELESQSEAVDALIEAGEEEGILEEGDRQLIQSVVEFRDKTVREVMTPRPEIVAVPSSATVEQFTELLRTKPYSRVPVFEGSIDNIRGLVFAHDVLQVSDVEARTKTVGAMIKPVDFVPESKQVQSLLREMQQRKAHMAIVIDEYGSVAGVVTIEDLLEEIVGEIGDEHEAQADIVKENDQSYIVPGSMDVDRLDELFGVRLENIMATTVAGLVIEALGRIPPPGEVVEENGLRFEILQSTDRRVERLRVSAKQKESSHIRA